MNCISDISIKNSRTADSPAGVQTPAESFAELCFSQLESTSATESDASPADSGVHVQDSETAIFHTSSTGTPGTTAKNPKNDDREKTVRLSSDAAAFAVGPVPIPPVPANQVSSASFELPITDEGLPTNLRTAESIGSEPLQASTSELPQVTARDSRLSSTEPFPSPIGLIPNLGTERATAGTLVGYSQQQNTSSLEVMGASGQSSESHEPLNSTPETFHKRSRDLVTEPSQDETAKTQPSITRSTWSESMGNLVGVSPCLPQTALEDPSPLSSPTQVESVDKLLDGAVSVRAHSASESIQHSENSSVVSEDGLQFLGSSAASPVRHNQPSRSGDTPSSSSGKSAEQTHTPVEIEPVEQASEVGTASVFLSARTTSGTHPRTAALFPNHLSGIAQSAETGTIGPSPASANAASPWVMTVTHQPSAADAQISQPPSFSATNGAHPVSNEPEHDLHHDSDDELQSAAAGTATAASVGSSNIVQVPQSAQISGLHSSTNTPGTPRSDSPIDPSTNAMRVSDLAPEPAISPSHVSQAAEKIAHSEMRIGFSSSVFGSVEVRTVIHANDVAVLIGSEKGDLRGLMTSEISGITNVLRDQNLTLTHVNFHQHGFSSANHMGGGGGDSHPRDFYKGATINTAELPVTSEAEPIAIESQICSDGLSIIA